MRKSVLLAGFTVALCIPLSALAQARPEVLVKQRQAVMTLQLKYFGPIAGMASGKAPYNADTVARNATYLENLSQMAWDTFQESTKGQTGSKALPAIWADPAKFQAAADRLQAEVAKLGAAARARDEAGVKTQFGAVGKACAGCHDAFRAE